MNKKPTYEELEQRVKELEQNALERMRVEAALEPNAEQKDLSNIEIENLQKILEKFSLVTGFTTAFIEYPSQEILVATGWRDIPLYFFFLT